VFLLTGSCEEDRVEDLSPGSKVYDKIAAASSGQIYDLAKTDISEVYNFFFFIYFF
jgi:hypothetical protein